MSIARTWRGVTRAADADRYLEYLHRTGLRQYAETPGNEGVLALRRIAGDRAEFTIVSLWRDEGAVERFAGSDLRRAVFYPEDDRFLVDRDETAEHYELVFARGPGGAPGVQGRRDPVERLVTWWTRWARPALPAPRTRERRQTGRESV